METLDNQFNKSRDQFKENFKLEDRDISRLHNNIIKVLPTRSRKAYNLKQLSAGAVLVVVFVSLFTVPEVLNHSDKENNLQTSDPSSIKEVSRIEGTGSDKQLGNEGYESQPPKSTDGEGQQSVSDNNETKQAAIIEMSPTAKNSQYGKLIRDYLEGNLGYSNQGIKRITVMNFLPDPQTDSNSITGQITLDVDLRATHTSEFYQGVNARYVLLTKNKETWVLAQINKNPFSIASEDNHVAMENKYDTLEYMFSTNVIDYVGEKEFFAWIQSLPLEKQTVTNFKNHFNISDEDYEKIESGELKRNN